MDDNFAQECEILVDRISYGNFTDDEKKLKISSGNHEIEVRIYDEFGGYVSDKINVEISERLLIKIINFCGIAALIAVIAIKIVLPKMKRKKRKMEMDARMKNKQIENNEGDKNGKSHD